MFHREKIKSREIFDFFDKILLLTDQSRGGPLLLVKGYFAHDSASVPFYLQSVAGMVDTAEI